MNTPTRSPWAALTCSWVLLLTAGALATGIAITILLAPEAFYAGYNISLSADPTLASELKAPAGTLLAAGLLMLAGLVKRDLMLPALIAATLVYLPYGLARLLSMALDGLPADGMVAAALIELAIGVLCLANLLGVQRRLDPARLVASRR